MHPAQVFPLGLAFLICDESVSACVFEKMLHFSWSDHAGNAHLAGLERFSARIVSLLAEIGSRQY
jgi:hypothetical protein